MIGDFDPVGFTKEEERLRQATKGIQEEPDLRRRYGMGLYLMRRTFEHIKKYPYTFFEDSFGDAKIEPTKERLIVNPYFSVELYTPQGKISGSFALKEAIHTAYAAISRYQIERKLANLPSPDQAQFDHLRLTYGAKAANLIALSEMKGKINRLRRSLSDVDLVVPTFRTVPAEVYCAWQAGEGIDSYLSPFFRWVSKLQQTSPWDREEKVKTDYIVRSSAVYSEDGEDLTGAGIYDSVVVSRDGSYVDFKNAVLQVYQSVDSVRANQYRQANGIDREEMGLVVQQYVKPEPDYTTGQSARSYANSRLPGVPRLMEIVTEHSRNYIVRERLDSLLGLNTCWDYNLFKTIHHFPPDAKRVSYGTLIRAAHLTSVLERIWGRDIQVEFVADHETLYFVQVRSQPKSLYPEVEINFPQKASVHHGLAIGIGDSTLPVLDSSAKNTEREGAVFVDDNRDWSIGDNDLCLPKKGAVIIFGVDGINGHVQTLCAEKGLICVFPEDYKKYRYTRSELTAEELKKITKVRVVANGMEGRLYRVD